MDSQFNDKIKNLLSDPESIKSLVEIASSLGLGKQNEFESKNDASADSGSEQTAVIESNNDEIKDVPSFNIPSLTRGTVDDERIKLLLSIKPFLNDKKRTRVDSLVKALGAAKIISTYKDLNIFG